MDSRNFLKFALSCDDSDLFLAGCLPPLVQSLEELSGRFSRDLGGDGTGYPLMRRSSPSRSGLGADWLIPFTDRDTGPALISLAGGGRDQLTTHFDLVLVSGGRSGETVISGEGGLLETSSVPAKSSSVEDFGSGGGMKSMFGSSQLRLISVNCLASSGGSDGDSEGIVITDAKQIDW